VTQENIPQTQPAPADDEPVKEAAKSAGRALLWLVIAIAVVVVILGLIFLGPLGLFILLPALIAIWIAASVTAAGPAAGA
jgi:hypothetical protein